RAILGQQQSLSFRSLFDRRRDMIVLVSLAADSLFQLSSLMGSLIVNALTAAIMRGDRPEKDRFPVFLYLDEFENFVGTSEQFEAIISEGRRFGLGLCLSHQSCSQLDVRLRHLIRNVVHTQIYFATGAVDAESLANEIPSEEPRQILRNRLMNQKIGEA